VSLADIDRRLLDRCLAQEEGAWEEFVNRFIGLIVHVINHCAQARSTRLLPEDRDDLTAEVFLTILRDDFQVLRRFRGQSSLATYLTVIARRVAVRQLIDSKRLTRLSDIMAESQRNAPAAPQRDMVEDRDQIDRLLDELEKVEAEAVKMFHLEGKSYQEISQETGIPMNTVGPTLSRARGKMRRAES
jgi:RNA polymerase sigma-70 factor (ECF subfamily)